jgi:hypothetical protein
VALLLADVAPPGLVSRLLPPWLQLRGFLAFFSQLLVTGNAFDKCTACSEAVVREYRQRGAAFLMQVRHHNRTPAGGVHARPRRADASPGEHIAKLACLSL